MKLKELRRCIDLIPDDDDDFEVSVKHVSKELSPGHTWGVEPSPNDHKVNIFIYE